MTTSNPASLSRLLTDPRFWPLFVCQFWSAFADNMFRSALIVLATYDTVFIGGFDSKIAVTLISFIFILPFFLFSSLAGQIADRYEKSQIVKIAKGLEIFIIIVACYGFATHSLPILLTTLFLSATQATFFGPLKYSMIPDYLKDEELMAGNGLVEASTFLAVLLGTLVGAWLVNLKGSSSWALNTIMMINVLLGFGASLYLQKTRVGDKNLQLNFNIVQETYHILREGMRDRSIFLTIIGISWFWLVGGIFLAQITTFGRDVINGNESVARLFMVLFALGIGMGSAACYRMMKGEISARLVPWGALGITVFVVDLVIASESIKITSPAYIGIKQFLSHFVGWRIVFDLTMTAFCGGLYTVPLYTLLQKFSGHAECSRMMAANNIANAFFMVLSSLMTMILYYFGMSTLNIFLIVGLSNLYVMYRISQLVPESVLQLILQAIFRFWFKVEVKGIDHFHNSGKRVLIIANHQSFLDAALLFAFLPEKISFAAYTHYVNKWWMRLINPGVNLFPVDPANPMAMKGLIEYMRQDRKCVIFPEGRITVTGSLMKIFDGPGMVADKANAVILPIRIDGAQFSLFSHLKGKVRRKLAPKISLSIQAPYCMVLPQNVSGRARRRALSSQLHSLMSEMLFKTSRQNVTLFDALIEASRTYGSGFEIAEDINRDPNSYRRLIMRSFILGRYIAGKTSPGEHIGILLPTSLGALVSFMGLHSQNRIPAMLNFSLGIQSLKHCLNLGRIRVILTSRKFMEMGRLENIIETLKTTHHVVFLEDVIQELGILDKVLGMIKSFAPSLSYHSIRKKTSPEDGAVILFTSGSEGLPKGVVLSHRNVLSNCLQLRSYIDLHHHDVLLNVLPMFHSFGLVGSLLPILSGIRVFLYPSPLHYRLIPAIAYDIDATLFFATDTFLSKYAKVAHPYDFYSIRYIFAGAEKLKDETRQVWLNKFGLNIFEGYGCTETSPALCVNTRMYNRPGSVGRFIPDIHIHLEKVPGIDEGGRLHVRGPNIMKGYLDPETGNLKPVESSCGKGWYDTGDIVTIDDEGFVKIQGRAKRFAKIGGEMISLVAIEDQLFKFFPEAQHAVFAHPDDRKGEQISLLTTQEMDRSTLVKKLKEQGLAEVMFPRRIFHVDKIPLLATGKVDFQGAQQIFNDKLEKST